MESKKFKTINPHQKLSKRERLLFSRSTEKLIKASPEVNQDQQKRAQPKTEVKNWKLLNLKGKEKERGSFKESKGIVKMGRERIEERVKEEGEILEIERKRKHGSERGKDHQREITATTDYKHAFIFLCQGELRFLDILPFFFFSFLEIGGIYL